MMINCERIVLNMKAIIDMQRCLKKCWYRRGVVIMIDSIHNERIYEIKSSVIYKFF